MPIGNAAGKLLVIRSGDTPFTNRDIGLLTAMGEALTLAARMLAAVDGDRESLSERHRLLERLTRIQRGWAGRDSLEEALDAVTAGAAEAPWRRGRGIGATHRSRRSIVLDHVVHQRGRGTTFTVRLPVGSAPRERVQEIGVV